MIMNKSKRSMRHKNVRAMLLLLSTLTYLLFGAVVFEKLEFHNDIENREEVQLLSERITKKYNFTQSDYDMLEAMIIKSIPHKAGLQWKFNGALFFAIVVLTTVGYGHSTPATCLGKLFCMLFILAGVPLGLIMFQSIGERVNTAIEFFLKKLRSLLLARQIYILKEINHTQLLIVSLSIGVFIIVLATYVFHQNERWTLFEAYYYCFMTLSTIGFGDYVPLQNGGLLYENIVYFIFTLLIIICGLALFSASINLLVLRFMATNEDVVTAAASRDSHRSIMFESFGETASQLDSVNNSNLIKRDGRDEEQYAESNSTRSYTNGRQFMNFSYNNLNYIVDSSQSMKRCGIQCECKRNRKMRFAIRRTPMECVERIVNHHHHHANDPTKIPLYTGNKKETS